MSGKLFHKGSRSSSLSLEGLTRGPSKLTAASRSKSSLGGGSKLSRGTSQQNLYGLITLGETAGVNVDDFEADIISPRKRISRVEHEHSVVHGMSGEELLTQKTQKPNMEGLEKFTQLNQVKDVQKKGMDKNVLQRVLIEDERQVTACMTLPSTFAFFGVFMILFQQHYTTSYVHLQESYLRTHMTDPANLVDDINGVWDWMSNVFIPFIYTTDQNLDASPMSSIAGGEFQQQIGGFLIRSQRSRSIVCEDTSFEDIMSFNCHPQDTKNTTGHHVQQDPSLGDLGGWTLSNENARRLQPSERLYPRRSADPSNLLEALLGHISRWLPGRARYVKAGSWRHTDLSLQESKTGVAYHSRRSSSKVGRQLRKSFRNFSRRKVWKPFGPFYRILDPMQSFRETSIRHSSVPKPKRKGRYLTAARPEFAGAGWIPNAHVMDDVWEFVVPMSMPQAQLIRLMQQWKHRQLLDPSTLFFGIEVILKNKAIGEGVLTHVFTNFIFSRGGNIYVETIFQSLVLADDKFVLFFGFIWIMLLVFNSMATPARTCLAYRRRKLKEYSMTFWNVLEWLVVVYGWVVVAVFLAERFGTRKFNDQYEDYRDERARSDPALLQSLDISWFDKIHKNVYNTGNTDMFLLTIVANFHLFLVLRYFVASRGQPRLAIVVNTFRDASVDLLHLLVVFGIIFFAYICSGHILFGRRMPSYSTLEGAIGSTIQIVLNREFNFMELSEQDFYTTCFWVFTFVILVVIIMINIVLAMIFDIYGDVRGQISIGDSLIDTIRSVYTRTKLQKVWIPNGEVLIATKRLPHEKITWKMIQEAVPGIPKKQLSYIFNKSKAKFDTIMMRGNKNALTEALTAVLLGIAQAKDGVAYMKGLVKSDNTSKIRSESSIDSKLPKIPSFQSWSEIPEDAEYRHEVDGQPIWINDGLIPLLLKQQERMDKVSGKLETLRLWMEQRGVGILTPESQYPEPPVPSEDAPIVLPWTEGKITVHSGRKNKVASMPPAPTCPKVIGMSGRIVGGTGIVYL